MLCWLLGLIGLVKNRKRGTHCEDQDETKNEQTVNVDSHITIAQ